MTNLDLRKHIDNINLALDKIFNENEKFNATVTNDETRYNLDRRSNWQKTVLSVVQRQMEKRVNEILERRHGRIRVLADRVANEPNNEDRRRLMRMLNAPFDNDIFNDLAATQRFRNYIGMLNLQDIEFEKIVAEIGNMEREQIKYPELELEFVEQLQERLQRLRCITEKVEAEYEEQACEIFQDKYKHNIPRNCRFQGHLTGNDVKVVGSWHVRRVDETTETITYKSVRTIGNATFYLLELINYYILEKIVSGLDYWKIF